MAGALIGLTLGYIAYDTAKGLTEDRIPLPGEPKHDGPWSNWMRDLRQGPIGKLPLKDVCLPGSHDAGMHKAVNQTIFGSDSVTRTQWFPISQQLQLGARVFDLRPVWSQNNYHTGHYTVIPSGYFDSLKDIGTDHFKLSSDVQSDQNWQGANGEKFDDIINAVNQFLDAHAELVILDLSDNNWFDVTRSFNVFDDKQYGNFYGKLKGIKKLWKSPAPGTRLFDFTLNQFLKDGGACVCIVPSSAEKYSGWKDIDEQGFFKTWHWYPDGKGKNETWKSLSEEMSKPEYVLNVLKDRADIFAKYLPNVAIPRFFKDTLLSGTVNSLPDGVIKRALAKNSRELPSLASSQVTTWPAGSNLLFLFGWGPAPTKKVELKYQVVQADAVSDPELARQCVLATTIAALSHTAEFKPELERMQKAQVG
jgi:hypothetical protein